MKRRRQGNTGKKTLVLVGTILAGAAVVGLWPSSNAPTPTPAVTLSPPQVQLQQPQQYSPSDNSQNTSADRPKAQPRQSRSATLSNDNYYTNSDGNTVHSPAYSDSVPIGATAQCNDGTYSFSQHRQGTCSHHGGVEQWLY